MEHCLFAASFKFTKLKLLTSSDVLGAQGGLRKEGRWGREGVSGAFPGKSVSSLTTKGLCKPYPKANCVEEVGA